MNLRYRSKIEPAGRGDRGFTLIEVMIAISLAAVVMTIISGILISMLDNRDYLEAETDTYYTAQVIMNLMARDFQSAFFTKNEETRIFQAENSSNLGEDMDEVSFTALSHFQWAKDVKESDQCEVEYFVRDIPEQKTNFLIRRLDTTIDEEPDEGGIEEELIEGVHSFNLRYYDRNDWIDDWSYETKFELPPIVEITLELENQRGEIVKFITKVELPLAK
jgi:general secretion pathway protein J